jgi:uncharacterized repeat protein (TIGR01451 family)
VSWQSPGKFAGSADGANFSALATPDTGAAGDVTNAVSYSGALYNGQICGGATELHSCIYRSLDGGQHWTTQNTLADNHPGASDRPWIDVYPRKNTTTTASNPDKDTVYLELANNTATATTTVVNGADLSLTKTGSPDPVHTQQNLTYTITVHNGGPLDAAGVSVTDQLPRNTAFGTATASQGTCSFTQPLKRIVTCDLGTIANGKTVTVTIVVGPASKKTTITNTASVSATTSDPNATNNSASATTTVVP